MQRVKESVGEDSMGSPGNSCSSPHCSLHRFRRSQSVSEVHKDVLNVSPRLSHRNSNIHLERRLCDGNSLYISEKESCYSCRNYMGSADISLPKSTAELIKEIATLELEVVHLERYLLSLYRTTFDQYLESPSSNTSQLSKSPQGCSTRPLMQDSPGILIEHRVKHAVISELINGQTDVDKSLQTSDVDRIHEKSDADQSLETSEMEDINCRGTEDPSFHNLATGSDTISAPSLRDLKYDEPKPLPGHRSLAEHLGASITDHVPKVSSKLSEDIIKCICAIYCKLAISPTQQMDLLVSPTPSASSSSTLSPGDVCDSWSPRCHYEATTSPSLFGSPKDKQNPYNGMVEIPKICIDGDRFGYASKMLNIFRSLIRRLEKINPGNMNREEQLAFWINIHNALVMHAFLAYGLHENQMKSTFSILKAAYDIGGHSVNAYVVQNSILGCQLHPPALGIRTLFSPSMKLKKGKGKHPYALKHPEPLAHFALCLGAYSDPAVRVYTAKNIHQELKLAKEEFIQANVSVQKESKIMMPKVLYYFSKDAALELPALVGMVTECMNEDQQKAIQECLLRRKLDRCMEWSQYKSSFRYLVHRDLAEQ